MKRAIPRLGFGLLLVLTGGAVWLYAVRGEALLLDLQTATARVFCL